MSSWYRWESGDLLLALRVQPRASRDAFAEVMGDSLKVRITAPPVDGKANTHLIAFLAEAFGVARQDVSIECGQTTRRKDVRIRQPTKVPPVIPE